jgi:hypothetical protein
MEASLIQANVPEAMFVHITENPIRKDWSTHWGEVVAVVHLLNCMLGCRNTTNYFLPNPRKPQ